MEEYIAHYTANSARSTRCSLLRRWVELHDAWFGDAVPVFPLTAATVAAVAAIMKRGRYRSYANYLSRAKTEHLSLDFEWGPALKLEEKRSIRSVLRGCGPSKQTAALDLDEVVGEDLGDAPLCPGGPSAFC
eukprot:2298072-Heterocapsa_arctica.AAC.1